MRARLDVALRAEALQRFRNLIDATDKNRSNPIRWSTYADSAAMALAESAAHNAVAVALLGEQTADLVIPATAAARTALEAGVKCVWLLEPSDPAERTARWLQYRANHVRIMKHWRDLANVDTPVLVDDLDAGIRLHEEFIQWQAQKAGVPHQQFRPPTFEEMLRRVKSPELYTWYREASQLVHAELSTLGLCLRSGPLIGSFVEPCHWATPISVAAMGLAIASRQISVTLIQGPSSADAVEAAYHSVLEAAADLYACCVDNWSSGQEALFVG